MESTVDTAPSATPVPSGNARPNERRPTYVPQWPPEKFIVPLLAEEIPNLFQRYGLPRHPGARALDAGCGMQPFRQMIEAGGYSYTGMDVVQNPNGTVDVIAALDQSFAAESFPGGEFDFILCTEVLEHVAGWTVAFANLARLLAPGGRLLLTCPHFYPLHEVPYDFWRPTCHAIEHFARENGFRILHLEQCGGPWEVLGTLLAETHSYPRSKGLLARIAAKSLQTVRNLTAHCLESRWWRTNVELKGPYYLSNISILEKLPVGSVVEHT
jgi:SAM-dependent methyltransferase